MIRRFNVTAALLGAVLAVSTAAQARDSEERQVPTFHGVKLIGSGEVTITVGDEQRVTITADDLSKVETEVSGDGVLKIKQRGSGWLSRGAGRVSVKISVADLDRASISGSGTIKATGIKAAAFSLAISGSGDAELEGSCASVKIGISGSGDVEARKLNCSDASVAISGSGDATVHADGDVKVAISGSGDVVIFGKGRLVSSRTSGSGDITFRGEEGD